MAWDSLSNFLFFLVLLLLTLLFFLYFCSLTLPYSSALLPFSSLSILFFLFLFHLSFICFLGGGLGSVVVTCLVTWCDFSPSYSRDMCGNIVFVKLQLQLQLSWVTWVV